MNGWAARQGFIGGFAGGYLALRDHVPDDVVHGHQRAPALRRVQTIRLDAPHIYWGDPG